MAVTTQNTITNNPYTRDIEWSYYTYKDGKGQEEVFRATDCVEISLEKIEVPAGSDNYNDIRAQMQAISLVPGDRMFYETMDVMSDYYGGKLTQEEVKNIYKEYCYHMFGTAEQAQHPYRKEQIGRALSEMYEYFSRANTRAANNQNYAEAKEIVDANGMNMSGTTYYNSDYYYACKEMQELFWEISDELAEEYGTNKVDFAAVEKNTRFTLDGGITYNGVWSWNSWQNNSNGMEKTSYLTEDAAEPPRGFRYFTGLWVPNGAKLKQLKAAISDLDKNMNHAKTMLLAATVFGGKMNDESLLFEQKNMDRPGETADEELYGKATDFLKKFHIRYWGDRVEILKLSESK